MRYNIKIRHEDSLRLSAFAEYLRRRDGRSYRRSFALSLLLEIEPDELQRWQSLAPSQHNDALVIRQFHLSETDIERFKFLRAALRLRSWQLFAILVHPQFLAWADGRLY